MQINFLKKTKAFSFAELMTVMAIMGIVLALTVPGLKTYSQRMEMQTLLKKSFATINQAFDRALADSDPAISERMDEWDFSSTATFMKRYFKPFLAVAKDCSTSSYDCFSNSYRNLDGTGNTNVASMAASVLLDDGTAMMVHGCNGNTCDIHVDLNGPKEPNIMGMDYWEFTVNKGLAQVLPNNEGGDFSTQEVVENNWRITKW